MAKIKPVHINAQEVRFSPKACSSRCANTCAPPECSNIPPNKVPKPTTVATKPKVPPIPSCKVFRMFCAGIPAKMPKAILARNKDKKAGSFKRKMSSNNKAILAKTAIKRE